MPPLFSDFSPRYFLRRRHAAVACFVLMFKTPRRYIFTPADACAIKRGHVHVLLLSFTPVVTLMPRIIIFR